MVDKGKPVEYSQPPQRKASKVSRNVTTLTGSRGPMTERYRQELSVRCSPGRFDELYQAAWNAGDMRLCWQMTMWAGEMSHGKPKQAIETTRRSPLASMSKSELAEIRAEVDREIKSKGKERVIDVEADIKPSEGDK